MNNSTAPVALPSQAVSSPRITFVLWFLGQFVAWLGAAFDGLGLLFPFVAAGMLLHFCETGRWKSGLLFFILTPLPIFFSLGVAEYLNGSAKLRFYGNPTLESYNLDPKLRCGQSPMGCLATANRWLTHFPRNLGVRTMTYSLGYMPQTYTGPYPQKDEALLELQNGTSIDQEELRKDIVRIEDKTIRLDSGVGAKLLGMMNRLSYPPHFKPNIVAKLCQEDCLILGLPILNTHTFKEVATIIVLIGVDAGRPFAYFSINDGGSEWHFPPVMWRSEDDIVID